MIFYLHIIVHNMLAWIQFIGKWGFHVGLHNIYVDIAIDIMMLQLNFKFAVYNSFMV